MPDLYHASIKKTCKIQKFQERNPACFDNGPIAILEIFNTEIVYSEVLKRIR